MDRNLLSLEQRMLFSRQLARRINRLLSSRNTALKEFLMESKFDERRFHRLFNENANPRFHSLCELAIALKVPLMELFNFDDPEEIECYPTEEEIQNALREAADSIDDDD